MVAVTYDVGRVGARKAKSAKSKRSDKAAPRKSWFARFMDTLMESRMQQARREIRTHIALMPYMFDESGHQLVRRDNKDMPVGGW